MKHKEITLLLAIVYVKTNICKDLDIEVQKPSEKISLHKEQLSDTKIEKEVPLSAPKFKFPRQLYNGYIEESGSSIRIDCIAEGNPTPNITWYKKETPIVRNSHASMTYNNWSLLLEEANPNDEGDYTCVICNELGCIYHTTQLSFKEQPAKPFIVEGYPGNVTIPVNETAILQCPVNSDLPWRLTWKRPLYNSMRNDDFENGSLYPLENIIKSQNPEDEPEQLTIYNVKKDDEGWYICLASNSLGFTQGQGYLKVSESDMIQTPAVEEISSDYDSYLNIIIAVLGVLFIVATLVVVTTCRKLKRERSHKRLVLETARDVIETYWNKIVTIEKPHINNSPEAAERFVLPIIKIEKQRVSEVKENISESKILSEYELPLDKDWEVPRETVVLGKVLGEGEFGKVVKAECVGVLKRGQSTVAVKMLKEGHSDAEMMSLVSEMEIMKVVGKHENIINLLGCCTQGGPLYVIVEFALFGNLRDFLRNHRPGFTTENPEEALEENRNLTAQNLITFAYQVAKGMEYLSSRHCIHRDIAARNVLVSENYILKIADFGLAKNLETEYYYRKKTAGKLPVRWMAPESLNGMVFTIQTDVWSFGVLLWEINTYGTTPYRSVPAHYLFQHLKAGHRLEKPSKCRLDLYLLMRECWSFSPKGRPSFAALVRELEKILTQVTKVEYLDLNSPHQSRTSQVTETLWLSSISNNKKETETTATDKPSSSCCSPLLDTTDV